MNKIYSHKTSYYQRGDLLKQEEYDHSIFNALSMGLSPLNMASVNGQIIDTYNVKPVTQGSYNRYLYF